MTGQLGEPEIPIQPLSWEVYHLSTKRVAGELLFRPMIAQGSPSCYDFATRNLIVLFIHFIATLAWLLGPGGVGSIVVKSLLLRHQLLIVNRSRQRSPNLFAWDRILARLDGALVAFNSSAPFRNCTEALDTARPSLSHEQAKVPDVILTESPTEARPGRTQRRTPSCARRNEAA
jgi:hypothetical protein